MTAIYSCKFSSPFASCCCWTFQTFIGISTGQVQLPPGVCGQVSALESVFFCAIFGACFLQLITECLIESLLSLNALYPVRYKYTLARSDFGVAFYKSLPNSAWKPGLADVWKILYHTKHALKEESHPHGPQFLALVRKLNNLKLCKQGRINFGKSEKHLSCFSSPNIPKSTHKSQF